MRRRIPDGIEERVSLRLTCRGYTAARWDVNAYRDRSPVEFLAVTASLLGPVILSTSLDVPISSMRHGSGQLFKSLDRNQRNTFLACFLGWALDAFDFFLLTFVIAAMAKDFGTSIAELTYAITLTLAMRPWARSSSDCLATGSDAASR